MKRPPIVARPGDTPIYDAVALKLVRPPRSINSWDFIVREAERLRTADKSKAKVAKK